MRYLAFLVVALVLFSCNKVELEPGSGNYSGAPIFSFNGFVDGDSSDFIVGENVEMSTYHEVIGNRSFVGTSFINDLGDTTLKFEFAVSDLLNSNSFSQPVDIGGLDFHDTLDIQDVPNSGSLMDHFWVVDGMDYQDVFTISEPGEYEVALILLSAGETYVLDDKLVVGSPEQFEPEILIEEVAPNMVNFDVADIPAHVDSVIWYWHDGAGNESYVTNGNPMFFNSERHVLRCEFYSQGVLVNYNSKMFSVDGPPIAPVISIEQTLDAIELASISTVSRGMITVFHNGEYYRSKENYAGGVFELTNLETFVEDVTEDEFLIGDLFFDTELFNQNGDAISVTYSGTLGLQKNPD